MHRKIVVYWNNTYWGNIINRILEMGRCRKYAWISTTMPSVKYTHTHRALQYNKYTMM